MSTHHAPQILKRILITLSLGLAFIVMASIFTPDRSRASDDGLAPRTSRSKERHSAGAADSANAHQGLHSLGTIETGRFAITIYATEAGPRYTIVERDSNATLGTLLSADQVQMLLPEIDIKAIDFSANQGESQQFMLAEPDE